MVSLNRKFGWHSGALHCRKLNITGNSSMIIGSGTSQALAIQNATNGTRLLGVYLNSTATGGDQRAAYFRLWSAGNGTSVSGEAVRAYNSCTGITGPVHGIHASVAYSTNMYCNNEAAAVRGTIEYPSSTIAKGTYSGVHSEMYTNGSSAAITSANAAFFRCNISGSEATAPAALNINARSYLFDFSNDSGTNYITAASGGFIDTDKTSGTHYGGLRIRLPNGNTAWIAVVSA